MVVAATAYIQAATVCLQVRGLVGSVERPAQLAALDADGRCALMRAAALGHGKVLEVLLEADERLHAEADGGGGGRRRRAHAVDRDGATALMLWVSGRPGADLAACTKLLLEAGSDTQALDRCGRCALLRVLLPPASRGAAIAGADSAPGGVPTPAPALSRTAAAPEASAAALSAAAESPLQRPLQARQVTLKPGLADTPHKGAAAEPAARGAADDGFVNVVATVLSVEQWQARLEVVKLLLAPQDFFAAIAALDLLPVRETAAAAAQQKRREQQRCGAEATEAKAAAASAAVKVAADAALAAESRIGGGDGGGGGGGGGGEAKANAERVARAAAAMAVVCDEHGDCALALAAEIKEALPAGGAGAAVLYETIVAALAPCGGLPKAGGFALVSAARSGRVAAVRALLGGNGKAPLARPTAAALSELGCQLPFSQLEAAEVLAIVSIATVSVEPSKCSHSQ